MSQRVSGYSRQPDDVYETPAWCVRVLIPHLCGHCSAPWDPANGPNSKIAAALRDVGFAAIASNDNFLARRSVPAGIDAIITNPPYGTGGRLACQFIAHALELAPAVVAMLLPVDFDSAKTRAPLFGGCNSFASKIVLLSRIVWFERKGAPGPSSNHAWFLWDWQHRGLPTIRYARKAGISRRAVNPHYRQLESGFEDATTLSDLAAAESVLTSNTHTFTSWPQATRAAGLAARQTRSWRRSVS